MKRLIPMLFLVAGCYHPEVQSGSFKCDAANKFICPDGLICDEVVGLCLKVKLHHDLGFPDLALTQDATVVNPARTCGDRVTAGELSNLTNLSAANGAGEETAIAVNNDGTRIYYLSGGALMTAPMTNPKTAGAPAAVAVTGVNTINGLTFASDGSVFIAGVDNTGNQLFKMHVDSPTQLTLVDTHLPAGLCAITDVAFIDGDITKDLYVAYPLAGCNMPEGRGSYIAQGTIDKQMGTFIAALPAFGYRSPYIVTGGLNMLLSSVGAGARLYYASRPSTDALWTGPANLPLQSIGGAGTRDAQAVVSPDCKTFYFSSERAGGKGGLDLWAADIAQQ